MPKILAHASRNRFDEHALKRRAETTALISEIGRGDVVLDVGCCDGYVTGFFIDRAGFVVGLDLSLGALKTLKSKLSTSNADFCRGDANELPFRSSCFDKIMALQLLEHLSRPEICTKEIDRCAKKNAIIIISIPWKEKIPQAKGCAQRWGHLHSFSQRDIISLLPNHYRLKHRINLPSFNIHVVTSLPLLSRLPLKTWLAINEVFGRIKPGYWAIYKFRKLGKKTTREHEQRIRTPANLR